MGATENAGFNAKVQRNLGLDLVTKQHKTLQKLGSADQRGSATGSHGVRETIPKSSNCLHGF